MPLSMRAGTPADLDQLVDVYFDAFQGNFVQGRVFPAHSAASRPFWRRVLADNFRDDHCLFRVMEDDATKDIAAFAIWNRPRAPTEPTPAMPKREDFPVDGDQDGAGDFFADLEEQHRRFMMADGRQIPHWYLELIATRKGYQGQGAAGALLRWGEQRADEQQLVCYLDATPDGRPVYTSAGHGFRVVDARKYFGGVYEHVFMIRDPKPGNSNM